MNTVRKTPPNMAKPFSIERNAGAVKRGGVDLVMGVVVLSTFSSSSISKSRSDLG